MGRSNEDNSVQAQGSQGLAIPEGRAADPRATGDSERVVRRFSLGCRPDRARRLIESLPNVQPKTMDSEAPFERLYHTGQTFVERTVDGLVLWRRPDRTWIHALRGFAERTPYPDALHLRIVETPLGCEVIATWRRHPLSRRALASLMVSWVVTAGIVVLGTFTKWWLWLILVAAMVVSGARFVGLRRSRSSLLSGVHSALAAEELGRADLDNSAFRAPRLPPSDR